VRSTIFDGLIVEGIGLAVAFACQLAGRVGFLALEHTLQVLGPSERLEILHHFMYFMIGDVGAVHAL